MANQPLQPNVPRSGGGSNQDALFRSGELHHMEQPLSSSPQPVAGSDTSDSHYLDPRSIVLQPRSATVPTTALTTRRTTKLEQECPNCGAMQPTSTSVCMACGTFFPANKAQTVHCRRCGTHASSNLHLCPGCGRELQAAPPRLLGWIAPVLLIALFLLFIQQWNNLQPLQWTQSQLATGWVWINEIGERLDPQIAISTIPATVAEPATNNNSGQSVTTESSPVTLAQAANATTTETNANDTSETALPASPSVSTLLTTTTPSLTETVDSGPSSTAVASTPTVTVVATASPTRPATATTAPTPTPSTTQTVPQVATSRATQMSATTPQPLPSPTTAASQLIAASADSQTTTGNRETISILQPTNTFTAVPSSPTPTFPTPTVTVIPTTIPTETSTPVEVTVYTVKGGDVPGSIATAYGISVDDLLAANGLGLEDARRLRVGQELIIPNSGQSVPTATVPPPTVARATSVVVTTAPEPSPPSTTAIRLDAPQLRSPETGSFLSCNSENSLTWLPTPYIREDDSYLLHLGFVNGYNTDGTETIVWVLEQRQPANLTIWRMDEGLCSLAPQEFGRQWRWYVEVVEMAGNRLQSVSTPSTIWAFNWN